MIYFETSALDGSNVNLAFGKIAENFVAANRNMNVDTANGVLGEVPLDGVPYSEYAGRASMSKRGKFDLNK